MKNKIALLIATLFVIGFGIGLCHAQSRQIISVDQNGNIQPPGYVAGLTDIARAEAQAIIATQSVLLAEQSLIAASNVVSDVVTALTGTYGFAYVTGHVVSFSGAVQVSTNAAAYIVFIDLGGAGQNITTNGASHDGHYVWHRYTAAMNSTPWIKYQQVLGNTNSWEFVDLQSTQEFSDYTLNGTLYPTIYRTTVWLPSSLSSAFFMAFCEVLPGGQAGAALDIKTGISIDGQALVTQTVTNLNGHIEIYITGLLKEVIVP
jgi:hypothetical protein